MPDLLFVYGTLRSSFTNPWAVMLRDQSAFAGTATVSGALAAAGSYTTWVPQPDSKVTGELYRMNNPALTLAALDEYEGDEWERLEIETSGGTAWIYRFRTA